MIKTLFSLPALICFMAPAVMQADPVAAPASTPGSDQDHYTVLRYLDPDLLKRHQNFGYTEEEIKQYYSYSQAFAYDTQRMDKSLIKTPPAPGINLIVFR